MNAKKELLEFIKDKPRVLCALIEQEKNWRTHIAIAALKTGYTNEDWDKFLEKLGSHDYDDGYGGQELFGTIWFTDGTWADRGEYDGSEWWEYRKQPEIPKELTPTQS